MEEVKSPGYIKNRIDIKVATINYTSRIIEMLKNPDKPISVGKNTKVCIHTNIGKIIGDIRVPGEGLHEEERTNLQMLVDSIFDVRNSDLSDMENSGDLVTNNSGMIVVENAKIMPYAQSNFENLEHICLFSDQILGFSLIDEKK